MGARRDRGRVALAAIALFVVPLLAYTEPRTPLTLAEAEALALAADPMEATLAARAEALDANAVAAGALPEPTLRVGLNNHPIDGGGFDEDGMTHAALNYRQAFPGGRTREYRSAVFEHQATSLRRDAEVRARELRRAVRERWLAVYFAEHSRKRMLDARPYFDQLVTVTRSQYALGRRNQQDVLQAELELARLDDRLLGIDTEVATQRARLAEWIADEAYRPLPEEPAALPPVPALAELQSLLEAHPLMRSAAAVLAAREADVYRADERSKPGWALDVGYGYREGVQPAGDPRSDLVTVGVTLDLPWFSSRSVDATLTSALAERRAAESGLERERRRLVADLAAEYARYQELGKRLALFDERILRQSAAAAEAALRAYRADAADFADVVRARIDDLQAQTDVLGLELERALSHVRLASLGGL